MRDFEQRHWTDTRVDTLKALAADGLKASEIAFELGGISRSSVLGKLHRLGIKLLGSPGGSKPRPKRAPAERRTPFRRPAERRVVINTKRNGGVGGPVQVVELPEIIDLPPDESLFACTIEGLGAVHGMDQCRWPLGEPTADMRYCGAPSRGSWCERHRRVAYKPAGRRG